MISQLVEVTFDFIKKVAQACSKLNWKFFENYRFYREKLSNKNPLKIDLTKKIYRGCFLGWRGKKWAKGVFCQKSLGNTGPNQWLHIRFQLIRAILYQINYHTYD